jgi:hypothetical protein
MTPCGFRIRSHSAWNAARSNQWNACAATTTSTLDPDSVVASAGAATARNLGSWPRRVIAASRIGALGSTAVTVNPCRRNSSVEIPVPAPTSAITASRVSPNVSASQETAASG